MRDARPEPSRRANGLARTFALALGLFYLGMALSEILLGSEGLIVRNRQVLEFAFRQNVIHWGIGAVLVMGFLAGRTASRAAVLLAGIAVLALAAAGVVARLRLGTLLGFDAALPFAYNVIHGLTGLVLLVAGLGRAAPARRQRF